MIFTVRRRDPLFKHQVGNLIIKRFVLTRLKVVPVRKNQTVILRQQNACIFNGIQTVRRLCLLIEDEVSKVLFLVGTNLHENEIADRSVENLSVVESLIRILNGFRIDPFAFFGIVFNLDGQITANRFDKDSIVDGNMGMQTGTMKIAMCPDPTVFMLRGKRDLVVATIVHIGQLIVSDQPLETLDVPGRLAHLKNHEQVGTDNLKFTELRMLVVLIKLAEILDKT